MKNQGQHLSPFSLVFIILVSIIHYRLMNSFSFQCPYHDGKKKHYVKINHRVDSSCHHTEIYDKGE